MGAHCPDSDACRKVSRSSPALRVCTAGEWVLHRTPRGATPPRGARARRRAAPAAGRRREAPPLISPVPCRARRAGVGPGLPEVPSAPGPAPLRQPPSPVARSRCGCRPGRATLRTPRGRAAGVTPGAGRRSGRSRKALSTAYVQPLGAPTRGVLWSASSERSHCASCPHSSSLPRRTGAILSRTPGNGGSIRTRAAPNRAFIIRG